MNVKVGWTTGTPLSDCDRCYAAGHDKPEGEAVRSELASLYIESAKRNAHRLPKSVVDVLVRDHLSPEEGKKLLSREDVKWNYTSPGRWAMVRPTWEMAASFLKSKASGFGGAVTAKEIKEARHVSCFGRKLNGEVVGPECDALRWTSDRQHAYCGDCGCKDHARAHLNSKPHDKLDYPYLECPRKKNGFSNATLTVDRQPV